MIKCDFSSLFGIKILHLHEESRRGGLIPYVCGRMSLGVRHTLMFSGANGKEQYGLGIANIPDVGCVAFFS